MTSASPRIRLAAASVTLFLVLTWLTLPPNGRIFTLLPVDPESGDVIFSDGRGANASTDLQKFIPGSFDAHAYVETIWDREVAQWIAENALAIEAVARALANNDRAALEDLGVPNSPTGTSSVVVTGTGTVRSIDTSTPRGRATVAIEGGSGNVPETVTFNLGPLTISSALRDALPFISLNDFTNQVQYADVSEALNDRAIGAALPPEGPEALEGARIRFVGAMSASQGSLELTPVAIERLQ